MKKLLLITSFLASQLFAAQCTEEQYEPFFVKNSDRYISTCSSRVGKNVFDKKSVIYDKENQTIRAWQITQLSADYTKAIMKGFWEFDIKNNRARSLSESHQDCNGKPMDFVKDNGEWINIVPNSVNECFLDKLKEYLNIKQ